MAMAAMGMEMRTPWTAADAALTFLMWVAMMTGMMTPSAMPMLLLFSAIAATRQERGVPVSALAFAAGYLVVWAGFSLAATLVQGGLHQTALLSVSMRTSNGLLGGGILIAAGLYQLTPFKTACLAHCRSPLGFLMTSLACRRGWRLPHGRAPRCLLPRGVAGC